MKSGTKCIFQSEYSSHRFTHAFKHKTTPHRAKGYLRSIESFILHIRKLKFRRGDLANVTCLFAVVFKFRSQEPCGVAQN